MDWRSPESRSRALYERARRIFPGAATRDRLSSSPYPPYIESGRGPWVIDVDGHRYLDLTANFGALIHGHAHPLVTAAVADQIERGSCFALPTEWEVRLGELLCGRVPGFARLRFAVSETEALWQALQAARAFTKRHLIGRVEDGHASTMTAASGEDGVLRLPADDLGTTRRLLREAGKRLAAVWVDPVPAGRGFEPLAPAYLDLLRKETRRARALLVLDEVEAFRLGFAGAQGRMTIDPDLTAIGRIIGGGLPVGALAGREDVMAMFGSERQPSRVPAGGSFTANPVSMIAGEAAMSLLDTTAFERLDALGDWVRNRIRESVDAAGVPARVTGIGSLFGIRPDHVSAPAGGGDADILPRLHRHLLESRILVTTAGNGYLSTVMRPEDFEGLFRALPDALAKAFER